MDPYKSSNAYKYEAAPYYIPEQEPKREPKRQQRKKKQQEPKKQNKAKMLLSLFTCFAITFLIMFRYVAIAEASNTVTRYKNELNEVQKVNEQLQVELDRSIDLKTIEKTAKNKLGMQQPKKYQVVYVQLDNDDYSEIIAPDMERRKPQGVVSLVMGKITNVLEYLY